MQEKDIENELIQKLVDLKYTYRTDITDLDALEANFRQKFEALNQVKLTESEFERLLERIVSPDVFACADILRNRTSFERDDGTPMNFALVNIKDWCKNSFEAVSQLRINTSSSHHVYDVVLLLNGVPVVQVELKNLQVSPYKAMQQIVDYKNDRGNGYGNTLMCFLQMFIVSNKSETWYFSNNNSQHFNFDADQRFLPIYQHATRDNEKVNELHKFSDSFLAKWTLAETISRYMVLVASEKKMLMMRPYQVYAVKSIVDCIRQRCGNGYIWHTTGSGKTLTSFKASILLKDNPVVDKCLFVVDRKDLDRQTREEFNRFQEGCVESNTDTGTLVRRLLSDNYADKVIVTTIQKLGLALDGTNKKDYKSRLEPLKDKRFVFIFDECHRSQFGDNHKAIKEFFPNAQLFGFTGTPIFDKNSNYHQIEGTEASYKTTESLFDQSLHEYTITHAIEDKNVLRFHVDYFKPDSKNKVKPGEALAKRAVVEAILEKHDAATAGRKFNAILATAKITDAIEYFDLFSEIQTERSPDPEFRPLNVACVFSPPAEGNKDVKQIQEDLPQEQLDNKQEPEKKKKALIKILDSYNKQYGTNHKISEFDLYYQDVQKRIKDQQYPNHDLPHAEKIDITIVVDMLLTGFDSKYLNTLYVDKNLKFHNLIQAFSRTNRVLNDSKPYGNIIDFRGQQDQVQEAIKLFSGEGEQERASEIWLVDEAPNVIGKLDEAKRQLDAFMKSQGLEAAPSEVPKLKGDAARSQFINLFKNVQKLKTQLDQYTDLDEEQKATISDVIPKDDLQGYKGVYIETAKRLRDVQNKGGDDMPPEVEQLDFEFVLFASEIIDYDYIMSLVSDYTRTSPEKREMSRQRLIGLIASDAKFMGERDDIEAYINSLEVGVALEENEIRDGFKAFKAAKNFRELNSISQQHGLAIDELQQFVDRIIQRYIFDDGELTELLRPLGLGWKERTKRKLALMNALGPLLRDMAGGREISGLEVYDDAG
ncbi:HsdR family type I site-specific deoxyribonuclease [Epibacterium sp. SM1979]|uniref:Type I restriction enzyme endonuclease subunit n=1 Tax=Tritonibacter litoralis TaxID=2662264 RepID=A0A843YJV2_9RHOB|nr:type I restriction endonuclease subunit R [Tritonibacter litoralis]MQQ09513.1 HsdR family type I site-specific deoxyribonuclease [Tritonibacter litoralis]